MPIGHIVRDNRTNNTELQNRLTAEWEPGTVTAASLVDNAPILIEDNQPVRFGVARKPLHLYVIWDDWEGMSQ